MRERKIGKKGWISEKMQCQFNVQSKIEHEHKDEPKRKKKISPGKRPGVLAHPNKQTHCPAFLQY